VHADNRRMCIIMLSMFCAAVRIVCVLHCVMQCVAVRVAACDAVCVAVCDAVRVQTIVCVYKYVVLVLC